MMQVKMFRAYGVEEVRQLETRINDWLAGHERDEIVKTETQMCAVGDPGGERVQYVVATIWYRPQP